MPASLTTPPTLVSVDEATRLGYGAGSTLRLYIREGRLPAVKIGARVKIRMDDLEALAVPKRATGTPSRTATFKDLESAVKRIVAAAPPLTADQRRRLTSLLGGAA